jgi:hypothetical protein
VVAFVVVDDVDGEMSCQVVVAVGRDMSSLVLARESQKSRSHMFGIVSNRSMFGVVSDHLIDSEPFLKNRTVPFFPTSTDHTWPKNACCLHKYEYSSIRRVDP